MPQVLKSQLSLLISRKRITHFDFYRTVAKRYEEFFNEPLTADSLTVDELLSELLDDERTPEPAWYDAVLEVEEDELALA